MKKKVAFLFFVVLVLGIIGLVAADRVQNPMEGNLYTLVGIPKEEITEVKILHYGKSLRISQPEKVEALLSQLDCELKRQRSDYFGYSAGGDWGIRFVSADGRSTESLLFFESNELASADTQFKIGHYYYSSEKKTEDSLVGTYWEEAFPKQ